VASPCPCCKKLRFSFWQAAKLWIDPLYLSYTELCYTYASDIMVRHKFLRTAPPIPAVCTGKLISNPAVSGIPPTRCRYVFYLHMLPTLALSTQGKGKQREFRRTKTQRTRIQRTTARLAPAPPFGWRATKEHQVMVFNLFAAGPLAGPLSLRVKGTSVHCPWTAGESTT
jgi:hypothetical protein